MKKKLHFILLIFVLPMFLTGCIFKVKTQAPPDGGIYRSLDSATTWEQKSSLMKVGAESTSFSNQNVLWLYQDPTDSRTIYASTREQGVFVTWDGGDSWRPVLTNKGNIISLAVDHKSPCTIYAAAAKEIFKSIDCGRKWESVFFEKRNNATITKIYIDPEDQTRIFMGTNVSNRGEIILSQDSGQSWQVIKPNFNSAVTGIKINPKNPRIMYATLRNGFQRSPDKGLTWENLSPRFTELDLKNADEVYALEFLPEFEDGLLIASKYGLLRSENSGADWQAYILLQQPNTINIKGLALNKQNTNEIYYCTDKGIYRTVDGGANWTTIKSPTSRQIRTCMLNPENPNTLYIGSWLPAK